MLRSLAPWIAAGLALSLALIQTARLGWLRRRPSRRARRRLKRALRGERDAERLLEAHGYVIEQRQATEELTLRVDGEPVQVGLRADLIVRRAGARYVAEVKTGELAPRIEHAATRRQLLEYSLAFDVDGVLLVEPQAGLVRRVEFPQADQRPAPARHGFRRVACVLLVVGLATAATWCALASR